MQGDRVPRWQCLLESEEAVWVLGVRGGVLVGLSANWGVGGRWKSPQSPEFRGAAAPARPEDRVLSWGPARTQSRGAGSDQMAVWRAVKGPDCPRGGGEGSP